MLAVPDLVAGAVPCDLEQPLAKSLWLPAVVDPLDRQDEGVLCYVFSTRELADDGERNRATRAQMASRQLLRCRTTALSQSRDELSVGLVRHPYARHMRSMER
jgi:hypothetical protein